MKLLYSFLLTLGGMLCTFAQTLNPYLQSVTPNSIYVNWKTDNNPETVVMYGTSPANLQNTVTGTNKVFSDTGYNNNYFYHTAKIDGLQPNTKYYYQIKTGNLKSDVKSFKTLPLPGMAATADGHIRFLVMGDNQMKNVPRYDSLVSAAKRKIAQKWGWDKDPSDNIAMTVMVGDQVDVGTLDHYENVHFKKNIKLSALLPIQTLVGNHETYGTLGMQAYYDHYVLDEMEYQGIKSGTENYYAHQAGNVLFLAFDTEHTGNDQVVWLYNILEKANADPTVDWIISLGHRPYQAEQYVGDISTWIRNTVMPILTTSPKHILHVGAHHHLYHRGQLKNTPTYQIISGGVAWDQYWGMAKEEDFEDVQKTIPNWIYQIVDVDVNNKTFEVESYSIGSVYQWKDNQLMDTFHNKKGLAAPQKPEITSALNGQQIELPMSITASPYSTSTSEKLNTTQFQLSKTQDFSIVDKEIYRDFENLYGPVGTKVDSTANKNLGVDITKFDLKANEIPNGSYYARVRYRDENLSWSPWSDSKTFSVANSAVVNTKIVTDTIAYKLNSAIKVIYTDAPGNNKDWIGLYKAGQKPGAATPSIKWDYLNGNKNGTLTFPTGLAAAGRYYAAIFENDSYKEIAPRQEFYVGPFTKISTDKSVYATTDAVKISFTDAPRLNKDWIGIYKVGHNPGNEYSTQWKYVTTDSGTFSFTGLAKGYYFAEYYLEDGYQTVGNRVFFQVGEQITQLMTNKTIYNLNENIIATWTNSPGIVKDWLGIFKAGDNPNSDPLISYTYFDGIPNGTKPITGEALPKTAGDYFIVMFTNDSYTEVSNRINFQVVDNTLGTSENSKEKNIVVYPNPATNGEKTFIKSKYPISQIDLFDMTGNLFYSSKNVNASNYSIINQGLPKGVYVMRIFAEKVYDVKMIIK